MEDKKPVQLKISVDEDVEQGVYVNFANIFHSPTEFILDFGGVVPGKPEVKILSRLVTSPFHAKRFMETLRQNIANYEKTFGSIRMEYIPAKDGNEEIPS